MINRVEVPDIVDFDLTGLFGQGEAQNDDFLETCVREGIYRSYRLYRAEVEALEHKFMVSYQVLSSPAGVIDIKITFSDPHKAAGELLGWRTIRFRKVQTGVFRKRVSWVGDDNVSGIETDDEATRYLVERFFAIQLADAEALIIADLLQNELKDMEFAWRR